MFTNVLREHLKTNQNSKTTILVYENKLIITKKLDQRLEGDDIIDVAQDSFRFAQVPDSKESLQNLLLRFESQPDFQKVVFDYVSCKFGSNIRLLSEYLGIIRL